MTSRKPWLTPAGHELSLDTLREISAFWDGNTWEAYLSWYEGPRIESIIPPTIFKRLSEEQIESVFALFASSAGGPAQELCGDLLSMLPPMEAKVLRLKFFGGRTF